MVQAMIAPRTPVSTPNRRGSRKTPDPIIEPTTIAVSVGRLTFSVTFSGSSVAVINRFRDPARDRPGSADAWRCTRRRRSRRWRATSPVVAAAARWSAQAPPQAPRRAGPRRTPDYRLHLRTGRRVGAQVDHV